MWRGSGPIYVSALHKSQLRSAVLGFAPRLQKAIGVRMRKVRPTQAMLLPTHGHTGPPTQQLWLGFEL
jgi:hypothetical protein